MTKRTILDEAAEITSHDRNAAYGPPEKNHARIADLWRAYFRGKFGADVAIGPEDVCWLMILTKCARDMETPKRDNLVDAAGYARNLEMLRDAAERAAEPNCWPPPSSTFVYPPQSAPPVFQQSRAADQLGCTAPPAPAAPIGDAAWADMAQACAESTKADAAPWSPTRA